jgi:NhaP-type Na+/H+ or K+/H+ antiporter
MFKRDSIVLSNKERGKITQSKEIWRKVSVLALAGGAAFWVANFVISLTPIAAEYRTALSISYLPMIFESLIGGLIIGCCVSYCLVRFFDRIPTKNPILKSAILSLVALGFALILVQVAASFLGDDALRIFLIGAMLNAPRFIALGVVIGYLYKRLNKGLNRSAIPSLSEKQK